MTAVEAVRTHLNAAWPHAPHVLERAKIGRQHSDTLSEIGRLQQRIVQAQAVSFEDAAVQLRRLVVMAEETPRPHALLSSPDVRGLVASVLAVVERESGYEAARNITFYNLLDARKPWRVAAQGRPRRDLNAAGCEDRGQFQRVAANKPVRHHRPLFDLDPL